MDAIWQKSSWKDQLQIFAELWATALSAPPTRRSSGALQIQHEPFMDAEGPSQLYHS